ncbi:ABC transporter ATP-binding protein [uncultured Negativibacillus sp.]|uniref:ABC transporter ATP-binding protein n=1 Tax=uncultured Negativibacillus sp. TaxID=1980696 RepID=UPI0025CC24F3|nr:ABC transporter ATP-binding protein [uncultured Negativibacillus sp.]
MSQQVLFELNNVCKYFPASKKRVVKAVDDISLKIYKGETLSLVGESGCGKTTLGRTVLGIYPKTSGEIRYKDQSTDHMTSAQKKSFQKENQMIFQDPYSCLDPRMSIGSIIEEGMKVHFQMSAQQRQQEVVRLLERVGLPKEMLSRFPHELSGGQRQRIGIARALATKPEFIVCDEPIAALDSSIQAQVINLMMDLQQELGLTYLFISHDLSMVRHISDRICIMYLGAVAELGEADEIDKSPIHPYTQALFSAVPQIDDQNWSSKRIKLEGEIPNPINAPKGCRFCTRCPLAKDICKETPPKLEEVRPGHYVACHCWKQTGRK